MTSLIISCDGAIKKDNDAESTVDAGTKYTITYSIGEDATASTGNPDFYTRYTDASKNKAVTISNAPSKNGYIFKGWKLENAADNTAATTYTIGTDTAQNITLVAVWVEDVKKIENVGDIITLGTVEWKAISVDADNSRALLISEIILEKVAFGSSNAYSTSTVRTYLNGDEFFKKYGLDKSYMESVDITSSIETTSVREGREDYVFLLSKTEYSNTSYFADDASRIATFENKAASYWTRSEGTAYVPVGPMGGESVVEIVSDSGAVGSSVGSSNSLGLRPAFWYTWK